MKPEIEVKFADVNHDELRAKLTALGAECVASSRLMRRYTYDFADDRLRNERQGWIRVRDEGDKVTLSYKQLNDRTLTGTHEVNVTVDSFERADDFIRQIGGVEKSYQETKRESWRLDGFEIELDEWPWSKPYIEAEGPDEAPLKSLAAKLGLDWGKALYGSVEIIYQQEYDVTDDEIDALPRITFDMPAPDCLRTRR